MFIFDARLGSARHTPPTAKSTVAPHARIALAVAEKVATTPSVLACTV
jgi:hypothetical protein